MEHPTILMSARTIHPFPARMAPEIALKTISRHSKKAPLNVLDPMCGSGTVLSIAATEGHTGIGFDVDPLAVLMSNVAVRAVCGESILNAAAEVVASSKRMRSSKRPWDDDETNSFAEYWFAEKQRIALGKLSRAIAKVMDVAVREALYVALSRIIVTKSPKASLAADTSHSRPHRVLDHSDYDVSEGFTASVAQLVRLLANRKLTGSATAVLGDSRMLDLTSASIDLVVTSPPYLNAIDYLRGHRLALIWIGYSIPALRSIRSDSIGAERRPDDDLHPQVAAMVDAIHRLVEDRDSFPRSIVERYAGDLTLFANELYRVCRPDARVVVVVGNSTLRDNFIRNDLLVGRALRNAGLDVSGTRTRDLPESRRYMPVSPVNGASAMTKRMRTEVIITAKKDA